MIYILYRFTGLLGEVIRQHCAALTQISRCTSRLQCELLTHRSPKQDQPMRQPTRSPMACPPAPIPMPTASPASSATTRPHDVERLAGSFRIRHTLAEMGARAAVAAAEDRAVRAHARRADRQPGGAAGQGRAAGDLSLRLAGRGRRQHRRRRCIRTSRCIRSTRCRTWCGGSTTRCAAATRSRALEGDDSTYWMAPIVADAEAGFGGALNAYELMRR